MIDKTQGYRILWRTVSGPAWDALSMDDQNFYYRMLTAVDHKTEAWRYPARLAPAAALAYALNLTPADAEIAAGRLARLAAAGFVVWHEATGEVLVPGFQDNQRLPEKQLAAARQKRYRDVTLRGRTLRDERDVSVTSEKEKEQEKEKERGRVTPVTSRDVTSAPADELSLTPEAPPVTEQPSASRPEASSGRSVASAATPGAAAGQNARPGPSRGSVEDLLQALLVGSGHRMNVGLDATYLRTFYDTAVARGWDTDILRRFGEWLWSDAPPPKVRERRKHLGGLMPRGETQWLIELVFESITAAGRAASRANPPPAARRPAIDPRLVVSRPAQPVSPEALRAARERLNAGRTTNAAGAGGVEETKPT